MFSQVACYHHHSSFLQQLYSPAVDGIIVPSTYKCSKDMN
ncbi:hypothetical protein BACCAP_03667 [Pseudoflavonifractor capillosus ATCC 29799]|uniref:Uncharacterized protein n=1 Tax=Pseudoflavonifractor capillosus ATCC 29799 TaxID=411467 RepID=A6NZL6_9FIRM|nr:hypothetical protein BACCAP_03667 [Pseudoflavonifractor capillosus ATCC 29799]